MDYYVALHANVADQHRVLDFSNTPESALGYARQIEDGEMIVLEATERLADLLSEDRKPLRFRITTDGKIDLITLDEYFAGEPETPAAAELQRLEALVRDGKAEAETQARIEAIYRSMGEYRARLDACEIA